MRNIHKRVVRKGLWKKRCEQRVMRKWSSGNDHNNMVGLLSAYVVCTLIAFRHAEMAIQLFALPSANKGKGASRGRVLGREHGEGGLLEGSCAAQCNTHRGNSMSRSGKKDCCYCRRTGSLLILLIK